MPSSRRRSTGRGAQPAKWFAWVHVFDPHAPYLAPDDFARRYPDNPYAAEVAWTDYALGAALRSLSPACRGRRSSSSPPITAKAWASTAS